MAASTVLNGAWPVWAAFVNGCNCVQQVSRLHMLLLCLFCA